MVSKLLWKNRVEISYYLDSNVATLRGQTLHWIGAQFSVFFFLDSRDKPLNMLKLCWKRDESISKIVKSLLEKSEKISKNNIF